MTVDRRAARREFKERKTAKGVFAIRCAAAGEVWVGSTSNLTSSETGVFFLLKNGMHHNKALQASWNTHGEQAFAFELLEQFEDDVAAMTLRDLFRDRQRFWEKELGGKML